MEANSIKSAEQNVVSAHKNLKEIEENYRKKGEKLPFLRTESYHGLSLMKEL